MARRQKIRKTSVKKVGGRRINRTKRSVVRKGSKSHGVTGGSLIMSGIRSLVSMIPGTSVVKDFANLIFKSIGVITAANYRAEKYNMTPVSIVGLGACMFPKYINIYGSSPSAVRAGMSKPGEGKGAFQLIKSSLHDAQLMSIKFIIRPSNTMQSRGGSWAMAFTPWRTEEDIEYYQKHMAAPEYMSLSHMIGAVTGPATQPLSLTFRPSAYDGWITQFHSLDSTFGMLCIAYEDFGRDSQEQFKPSEFMCDAWMEGRVKVRSSYITVGSSDYYDNTTDGAKLIGMMIRCGATLQGLVENDLTVTPDGNGTVRVTGKVIKSYEMGSNSLHIQKELTLDDMVIC